MKELRERLIDSGWKQGVILDPSCLQQAGIATVHGTIGFLVLTQTCDCINPDFTKEPYLELLPLMLRDTKSGKPDRNYENGKNPREIHFWISLKGEQKCVVSRIKDIHQVNRERIEEFRFSKDIEISLGVIDDLVECRAARYSRTAFPEAFESAFRTITERFSGMITKHESEIDSLLIAISPFDEIDEGDCYEIQLLLMVVPSVMGQPATIESLKTASKEIELLMMTCEVFGSAECMVANLDEMTIWAARDYVDFSRFDYLSFGKEAGYESENYQI